jgi:predicted deacylase
VLAILGACGISDSYNIENPETLAMVDALGGKEWQRVEIVSGSDHSGYVRRAKDIGTQIAKGDNLGEVVGLDGRVKGLITAPDMGVLFIWHDDPRVHPGAVVGVMLKECLS